MLEQNVATDVAATWFLVQVKPNCDAVAERNLDRQGFATFLPREDVTRELRGRFVTRRRPVFPGYLFVSFDPAQGLWRKINATYGVARLVSFGAEPAAVPDGLVAELQARCSQAGVLLPPEHLQIGDAVVLTRGPFANFAAEVVDLAPDQRVWVLLDVMGAERRVAVDAAQLRGA